MKFSICNLGCKVNAYEAEAIASLLENKGWQRVNFEEEADACMIFTCAVTNIAAQKSRKMMHRIKRSYPNEIVVMAGCYAQLDDGMLQEAEIVVGTAHKKEIPECLEEYLSNGKKIRRLEKINILPFEHLPASRSDKKARTYLKVQDGCNQFCTYCVIPFARGRERSLSPEEAVKEACALSENYNEIVLTGIHTGRYGKEYDKSLASLMEDILQATEKLQRLRISSIEITEVTDELIQLMQREKRIARHLHIPLQSGSNAVLQRMGRPYTTEEYYQRIQWIREQLPDVAISCDLITGFPQESDEEFSETEDFLKKCGFSFLHVFPYSPREGTKAAVMKGQIDPKIKKQRASVCLDLSKQLADSYQKEWIGKEAEVLLEETEEGYTKGYTSQYIPVRVKGEYPHGMLMNVILEESSSGIMYARKKDKE